MKASLALWIALACAGSPILAAEDDRDIAAIASLAAQAASAPDADFAIWKERIASRRAEIDAALRSLIAADRAADAMKIVPAFAKFWTPKEARDWYARVLALRSGLELPERLPLLLSASSISFHLGDEATTRRWAREALDLAKRRGDGKRMSTAYFRLSQVELRDGDLAAFHRWNDTMLGVCREMQDERCEVNVRNMRGEAARVENKLDLAAEMNEKNLAYGREHNETSVIRNATFNLAFIDLARNKTADVRKRLSDALPQFQAVNDETDMVAVIIGMAIVADLEHQPERAARLLGASTRKLETLGTLPDPADEDQIRKFTSRLRWELGRKRFRSAFDAGRKLSFEQALDQAMR